jgi:hypothetical protein
LDFKVVVTLPLIDWAVFGMYKSSSSDSLLRLYDIFTEVVIPIIPVKEFYTPLLLSEGFSFACELGPKISDFLNEVVEFFHYEFHDTDNQIRNKFSSFEYAQQIVFF